MDFAEQIVSYDVLEIELSVYDEKIFTRRMSCVINTGKCL